MDSRPASIETPRPSASSTIPSPTPIHSGKPVKGRVAPAGLCSAARTAEDSRPARFEPRFVGFDRVAELSVLDFPPGLAVVLDELPGSPLLSSVPPLTEPVGGDTEPQPIR